MSGPVHAEQANRTLEERVRSLEEASDNHSLRLSTLERFRGWITDLTGRLYREVGAPMPADPDSDSPVPRSSR